jgi:exonuclease III
MKPPVGCRPPIKFGTVNICDLSTKMAPLLDIMQFRDIDVLAVQEAYVGDMARAGLAAFAASKGYNTFFGSDTEIRAGVRKACVLLFSRAPAVQFHIPDVDQGRVVGIAVHRPGKPPMHVVSLYGHCGDPAARDALIEASVSFLFRANREFLVLGDFNCPANAGASAWVQACGWACGVDDDFHAELPESTRRGSKERIDYALASRILRPTAREQVAVDSDHDMVLYEFGSGAGTPTWCGPRRAPMNEDGPKLEDAAFHSVWEAAGGEAAPPPDEVPGPDSEDGPEAEDDHEAEEAAEEVDPAAPDEH